MPHPAVGGPEGQEKERKHEVFFVGASGLLQTVLGPCWGRAQSQVWCRYPGEGNLRARKMEKLLERHPGREH